MRFRSIRDICKMYRCVRMMAPDNYYQNIVWRDFHKEELSVFKLDTVTYGTKPASFLSVRVMHQLVRTGSTEGSSYPIGSAALLEDFYVDDLT